MLSTSGKQVDAEEKVVLLLQGVLETLSDRSVDKSQACHALTLVFNIYCRLADSTNARLLSILSAIMRIVTIEIALCRDALLDVMNHLLSAQPDAAANCLIDLPSHCSCDGLPTNVVRDLHFAHMLVEMRLWVSASPSYSLVNSLSSSAYFWQKTLLADLRKSKNVTALVKVYRLQIAIMTQCHRHIQRVHSPEFCPMRWRILQFVSRLLVFSRDICCAEIFPFVSPFINGVGAILSVAFPLTIDCADQLDSEILNSFFRNLRSFCSSLVLDLKSNLNYIAESSLSLAKLCFLCVSPKFQVITKHSMESMDFFHLTESVITGLSLNDPKTVSVEADSPIARLPLLYSQLYFYQLRKLDSNMRSECAILAVSKEFWTFVGDLRIGGALLNHFCNNFYTEGKSSILDSVSNPENRVRDLVNLFNMCVSCGCSHHSELAESLQTDLRCYLIRLLMLVGQASNNGLISMLRSFDTKTELHSKVSESEKPVSVVNQIVFVRRNIAGAESVQFEGIWNVDSAAEGRIRSALLDAMHGLKQIVHSLTSTSFSSDFITIYLLRIFPSDLRRLFQLLHIHGCKLEQANLLKFVEKVLSSSEFQRVSITKVLGRSEIVCLWSSLSKEFQCLLSIDKFIRNDIARGDCLPLELFPSDTSWAETIDRFCRICSGLFLIEDVSAELDISVFDSLLQSCLSAARSHCASLPKDSAKEVAEPLCAWLNLTAARIYICVFGDYARCENSITSSIDCAGLSTQFYLRMIQAECSLTSADLCDVRGDPEGASLKATEAVAYATSVSPSFCNICKLHVSRIYYRLNQSEHLQELLTSIIYGEKEREVPGSNLCIVDVAKILFDTFISNKDLLSGIDARFRYTDRLWNLTNLCRSSVRAPLAFNACKFSLLLQNWYVCWDQVSVIVDKSSSRKMFDSLVASAAKLDLKVPFDFNSEIRSRLCKAAMQLEIDSFAQFWISCSSIGVTMEYMKTCETSTGGLINLLHNDKHDELKARLEHLCNRGVDTIIFLRVDQAENRVIVGRYDTDGSLVEVNIACEARAFLHCYDKWIQLVNDCNSQLHNNSDSDASARGSNSAKKEWWSRRSAIDDKFKSLLGEIEGILGPALRLIAASSILDSSLDKLADLSLDEKNAEISSAPTPDYAAMKVSELKQLLTAKGIAFNAKALKADLVSILSQVDFTQEIEVCRRSSTANEILSPESRASLNNTNTGASVFDIHHQGQQSIRASGRVVLVLDEFFQSIPIESLPSFRNRSCCRMPSLSLLLSQHSPKVSPLESGWYCIDPDGNLPETAETVGLQFLRPISDRKGWTGFVSAAPPPMEFRYI